MLIPKLMEYAGLTGMILAIIASINWGLVEFLNFNILDLFNFLPELRMLVVALITVFGIIGIPTAYKYYKDKF